MDSYTVRAPLDHLISWWIVAAVFVTSLVVMFMTARIRAVRLLALASMITAITLGFVNLALASHAYEVRNPQLDEAAHHLGLRMLPGSEYDPIHANWVFLNTADKRFTNCYVERSRVDAQHLAFRLKCLDQSSGASVAASN